MLHVARPRLLYAATQVLPGNDGRAVRAAHTLQALAELYEVDALTLRAPGLSHIDRPWGVRLWRVPSTGSLVDRIGAFSRAMRRQLASGDYDAVHCADAFGAAAALAAKIQHGFKLVVEAVGFPSVEIGSLYPELAADRAFLDALRRDEEAALLAADAVIVGSSVTRAYAQERGARLERVRLIPPAVDLAAFAPGTPPPAPPLRLVYAGSLAPWQGLPTLLFALRRLPREVQARAVIAAPRLGRWRESLARLARADGLADRVRLVDPLPHEEVPALLAGAHVAVAPLERTERNTRQGAAPLKLVEAMAAGLAVVTSDLPATREMCGDAALYFKAGDERSLATRLERLASDPDQRARLGKKARARVSRYNVALFRAELREIYGPWLGAGNRDGADKAPLTGTPTVCDTGSARKRGRAETARRTRPSWEAEETGPRERTRTPTRRA